jgi:hypothetical protein
MGAHRRWQTAAAGGEEEGGGGGYGGGASTSGGGQRLNERGRKASGRGGGFPSTAMLAQPAADGTALPLGLANRRSRRHGEGGG